MSSEKVIRVSIGFGILDTDTEYFLIGKTAVTKPYPNLWSFPGGKVEEGETPIEAVEREWQEETNTVPLHVYQKPFDFLLTINGKPCEFFMFNVLCSGKERANPEAYQELKWIRMQDKHLFEHSPASTYYLGYLEGRIK